MQISQGVKCCVKVSRKNLNDILPKAFACIAITLFMVMMLAKPQFYLSSAQRGLCLFATSVLPSIFPFYFCSLLLTFCGAVNAISKFAGKPISLIYRTQKETAYALFLSLLCGYPVGASTICELYENGILSEQSAKTASVFCQNAGPVFIIGTIGGAIFKNQAVGWTILLSHYLGAILNGLLYRPRKHPKRKDIKSNNSATYSLSNNNTSCSNDNDFAQKAHVFTQSLDVDNIMSKAIAKSTTSMLCVGGYIVICGMLADTLDLVGVTSLLSALGERGKTLCAMLYGIMEMTRGSLACANIQNQHIAISLCSQIISLGGLSIFLQNYNYLTKCNISFGRLLLCKLSQCVITFPIAFILSFCI